MDDEQFKRLSIGWHLEFSLLPRRCYYTKKRIWFKFGYMGTALITGPGEPLFEYRWVDRKEWLLRKIAGQV